MPYRQRGRCVEVQRNRAWQTLKCHDSADQARAHLTALNMNVDEAHKMTTKDYSVRLFTQEETEYTRVSPQMGEQLCANCRWFRPSDTELGAYCHIVEMYPEPILPTGWCNQWIESPPYEEGEMMMRAFPDETPIPGGEQEERHYAAPLPADVGKIKRLLGKGNPDAVTIVHQKNGPRLGIIITSNGYQDRDQEHVATQALEGYIESAYQQEVYVARNEFDFYHDHRLTIGDVIGADMVKGFLVEIVRERDESPIARALWDYWERTQREKSVQWGASHEFITYGPSDGVHTQIAKRRTSLLPVAAAANLYTYSGVVPNMSDKAKHLDTLFATWGIEKASEILEKEGVAALAARLAEAGHTAKATDELPVKDESETKPGADLAVLVTDLLEALGDYAGKVDAQATDIKALHDARQKAADEANAKIAALVEKVKALEEWKAQTPRASQDGPAPTPQQAEEFKKQDVDPVREFLFGKKG